MKPRAVKAYGVSRRMTSGRNQPLLVLARDGIGRPWRCVVKARPRLAAPPSEYLFEWLGSALARRLGLTVPDPLAVTITSEFASAASTPFRMELAVDQARGKLSRIVEVLRRRRDAVDDWLPKVFACLDK